MSEPGLTDEQMQPAEPAYHEQAEKAYADLLTRGEDTDEAVTDLLDAYQVLPTRAEGFVIDSLDKACWALRKIVAAERRKAERAAFVARERARLEGWQGDLDKGEHASIDFLTNLLRGYYERQRESGALGKAKSIRLPYGRLQMRETGGDWTPQEGAEGEAALFVWAKANGLTQRVEKAAWGTIKALLVKDAADPICARNGEIVPGIVRSQVIEQFSVKLEEGE